MSLKTNGSARGPGPAAEHTQRAEENRAGSAGSASYKSILGGMVQLKGGRTLPLLMLTSSVVCPAGDTRVQPAATPVTFLPSRGCALVPGRVSVRFACQSGPWFCTPPTIQTSLWW